MKRVVGYAISVSGIVLMLVGFGTVKLNWAVLKTIKPAYITWVGIIAVAVGVILALLSKDEGKAKQAKEEVPIYEGKKIVGYRRK